jgi:hypothetical protein
MEDDFAPPNAYEHGLTRLRAAEARTEDAWKVDRLRALEIESAEMDAEVEANPFPSLTAAEAAEFAPPDAFEADLKALQASDARRRDAKEAR